MKLITYRHDGAEAVGLLWEEHVVPVNEILRAMGKEPVRSMLELIGRDAAENLADAVRRFDFSGLPRLRRKDVTLLAPIPRPARNIFCLGKNYAEHATEVKMTRLSATELPTAPIYFTKTAAPALGDGGRIRYSAEVTKMVDYEAELAVVIGKEGKDIAPEEAEDYIFGYTILNDVSARDLQARHEQWFKGKNLDTFCPMGPCIVDKSEISFPVELEVECRVNGELRQHANTRELLFGLPVILSDLSRGLTLLPGDIISTGTPAGVGAGFNPPRFLIDGDRVECSVEKIGTLRSTVVEEI